MAPPDQTPAHTLPPPPATRPRRPISPLGIAAITAGALALLAVLGIVGYVANLAERPAADSIGVQVTGCTTQPGDRTDTVTITYTITNRDHRERTVFVYFTALDPTGAEIYTTSVIAPDVAPGQTVTGEKSNLLLADGRAVARCVVDRVQ